MNWHVEELDESVSTFNEARRLPAWWVVSAVRQTGGRGRFNRTWFGEEGGLWATYNVPIAPEMPVNWGLLPLVAGVAIMRALAGYEVRGLRLRWPNDVLVGRAKLAGILVERPAEHLASIGIGINIENDIQGLVGRVQDVPARLADWVSPCPSVAEVRARLAAAIDVAYHAFVQGGIQALAGDLHAAWNGERRVELLTDAGCMTGVFIGIADDGSPILRREDGSVFVSPGIEVLRLRELECE